VFSTNQKQNTTKQTKMKKVLSFAFVALLAVSCKKNDQASFAYEVTDTSVAEWTGRATDHANQGLFEVTGSFTTTANGIIKEGKFVIPISSIDNYNLPEEVKPQLLEHLKSPDFFNVLLHPTAEFVITKVQLYSGGVEGAIEGANYLLTGDFTMVGQTHPVSFPARVAYAGQKVTAEATFKLDRTKWGMTSYSDPGQGLYIYPDVDMHLDIEATRK
jgi:polyisoprenoid-binding protein YceI